MENVPRSSLTQGQKALQSQLVLSIDVLVWQSLLQVAISGHGRTQTALLWVFMVATVLLQRRHHPTKHRSVCSLLSHSTRIRHDQAPLPLHRCMARATIYHITLVARSLLQIYAWEIIGRPKCHRWLDNGSDPHWRITPVIPLSQRRP